MESRQIRFDSILLFALVIPVVMTFRIWHTETPYWLFGFIFAELLGYLVLDVINVAEKNYEKYKNILVWCTVLTVILSVFAAAIVVRHKTHPIYDIHDIVLQQEAAIRFLLDGKNPYATTYFGTFLEEWHYTEKEVNPALYHFVMEPFYLLFALPFYFVSNRFFGFFDGRIPLLFLFILQLISAFMLVKDQEKKRLFLILLAFNPALFSYTLEGRSDMFMYPFLFMGFYLLYLKRYIFSGVPIALAFAIKQSAWPLFPFYLGYIYFKTRSIQTIIKTLAVFLVVFLCIVLPFFFWNQKAFLDSTVYYLSGQTEHSYPISGYGFGMILHEFGVIKNVSTYFPFIYLQVVIGLPVLIVLIKYLRSKPVVSRLIVAYGIFLFVFWYFSRYFNNSHLGYLTLIFITSYFWEDEK